MASDRATNLIWIDLEMTGLEPDVHRIIEVATIVTDSDLNVIAEGPELAVSQGEDALALMDDWNQHHHGTSGLIERVRASELDDNSAEQRTIEFLAEHVEAGASPMCGNSICQDRRFLARWMPGLEAFFHYRNLDVSTLKLLCRLWARDVAQGLHKQGAHRALADIRESIAELEYYREHFIRLP